MNIKGILLLVVSFFSITLFVPKTSRAFDLQETLSSENSVITKIQEGLEYFFAFKIENKVQVLEKHAEKRLVIAQEHADEGNQEKVQNLLQNYLQIKERQNNLLGKVDDEGETLEKVQERVIEQQKTMEEIKTKVEGDQKQRVIQVQEQVVNQVAERVVKVNGTEGQAEFFRKVEHVWAPGTTGPASEQGVIIEGGTMQFAPGTSAGGPAGADIKTVEVKTGGGEQNTVENGGGGGLAPGTTQGGTGGDTVEPGGVDPGNSSDGETWLAP